MWGFLSGYSTRRMLDETWFYPMGIDCTGKCDQNDGYVQIRVLDDVIQKMKVVSEGEQVTVIMHIKTGNVWFHVDFNSTLWSVLRCYIHVGRYKIAWYGPRHKNLIAGKFK